MIDREQFEDEVLDLQETVVGDAPRGKYTTGFRDGLQHAIVIARGIDDE